MTTVRIEAPAGFRRLTLITALLLVGLELGVFWFAARLTMLLAPRSGSGAELGAFIGFWSLLTLQAMAVAGFAWTLVALSRTVLDGDEARVVLSHPWRRWTGTWSDIAEAYVSRDWLHIRARGRWRTWHAKLSGPETATAVERLRSLVPSDAWLTDEQARGLMMKRLLPPVLIGGAVGAGAVFVLKQWMATAIGRTP
jgi:hypothetical protein